MKKRNLGPVAAVAICFLFGLCTGVWAGINPSPWKPEINKLKAVAKEIQSVNRCLQDVLTTPPENPVH